MDYSKILSIILLILLELLSVANRRLPVPKRYYLIKDDLLKVTLSSVRTSGNFVDTRKLTCTEQRSSLSVIGSYAVTAFVISFWTKRISERLRVQKRRKKKFKKKRTSGR